MNENEKKLKIFQLQQQFNFLQTLYYDLKDLSDDIGEKDNWLLDILADVELAKNDIYEYIEDLKEEN